MRIRSTSEMYFLVKTLKIDDQPYFVVIGEE